MDELIEVLDEHGQKTGIVKAKKEIKKAGDFHLAISVLIMNDKNEILLQKRSKQKITYPNLWSMFVKGHVQSHENSIEAALRELEEELGIAAKTEDLKFLYCLKEEKQVGDYIENIFFDTFFLKMNVNLKNIKMQKEEVSAVKFMKYQDFLRLVREKSKEIVPNYNDYSLIEKLKLD